MRPQPQIGYLAREREADREREREASKKKDTRETSETPNLRLPLV